jgi:hypothetical protein
MIPIRFIQTFSAPIAVKRACCKLSLNFNNGILLVYGLQIICTLIITVGLLMQRVWSTEYGVRVPHLCNAITSLCARPHSRPSVH